MIHPPAWLSMLLGSIAIGCAGLAAGLVLGPALVQIGGETAARLLIVAAVLLARFAWARTVAGWMRTRRAAARRIAVNVLTAAALGWVITTLPLAAIGAGADIDARMLGLLGIDLALTVSSSLAGILLAQPAGTSGAVTSPAPHASGTVTSPAPHASGTVRTALPAAHHASDPAGPSGALGPSLGP